MSKNSECADTAGVPPFALPCFAPPPQHAECVFLPQHPCKGGEEEARRGSGPRCRRTMAAQRQRRRRWLTWRQAGIHQASTCRKSLSRSNVKGGFSGCTNFHRQQLRGLKAAEVLPPRWKKRAAKFVNLRPEIPPQHFANGSRFEGLLDKGYWFPKKIEAITLSKNGSKKITRVTTGHRGESHVVHTKSTFAQGC